MCIRFFYILVIFIISSTTLVAQIDNQYEKLKAQYLTLRNTDLQLKKVDQWILLAGQFEKYVDKNKNSVNAPAALLNAAILLQIVFQNNGNSELISKAENLLIKAEEQYKKHSLVDDVLLKHAEIKQIDLEDNNSAMLLYNKILSEYPDSDTVAIARQKLDDLERNIENTETNSENDISADGRTVIVIDPGHGGEDFGAVGVAKALEKDIVLSVAFDLEKLLKQRLNAIVHLTRRDDSFVPLAARTKIANDLDADLFISLHANSSPGHKASGLEVYYLDNSNDQASKALAERENASLGFEKNPTDVQIILSELIQNTKLAESIKFANVVNQNLINTLKVKWPDVKSLGVKKAPFYVLVGAHMPCILVELFFVDNIQDGTKLLRRQFRQGMSEGLYLGIANYLKSVK
jgi:N-acetylmuramoyl-L-alanine amidase